MNTNICEKCGTEMIPINADIPIGMTCPKCGWGWATSYIDPMLEDETEYSISLSNNPEISMSIIKVIASIANTNYVQAKELIESGNATIYTGNAFEAKKVIDILKTNSINYLVNPEFPY